MSFYGTGRERRREGGKERDRQTGRDEEREGKRGADREEERDETANQVMYMGLLGTSFAQI